MSMDATEMFNAKLTFERESQSQGVVIKGYHTVNGILNASEFMVDMLKNHKKIRFSGDGASRKNGAAEHAIKTVVTMSSTMLIYDVLVFYE